MAKIRKSRGNNLTLQNDSGDWITDNQELKELAVHYFNDIFTTTLSGNYRCANFTNSVMVSDLDCKDLGRPITLDEIRYNLFQMDPIKGPGPDGIQLVFYQKYWNYLCGSLTKFCA